MSVMSSNLPVPREPNWRRFSPKSLNFAVRIPDVPRHHMRDADQANVDSEAMMRALAEYVSEVDKTLEYFVVTAAGYRDESGSGMWGYKYAYSIRIHDEQALATIACSIPELMSGQVMQTKAARHARWELIWNLFKEAVATLFKPVLTKDQLKKGDY